MADFYLGIDPGTYGALAVLDKGGSIVDIYDRSEERRVGKECRL